VNQNSAKTLKEIGLKGQENIISDDDTKVFLSNPLKTITFLTNDTKDGTKVTFHEQGIVRFPSNVSFTLCCVILKFIGENIIGPVITNKIYNKNLLFWT
jgi:hypothetical protein